jgi:hypothetical protein
MPTILLGIFEIGLKVWVEKHKKTGIQDVIKIMPLDPLWILTDYLTYDEYSVVRRVCKQWNEGINIKKEYWTYLLTRCCFYSQLNKLENDLFQLPIDKNEYLSWKKIYAIILNERNDIAYVQCLGPYKNRVFGNKIFTLTKYWSYFHQGVPDNSWQNLITLTAELYTIQLLKDHGFTKEIVSPIPKCRAFVRNENGKRNYLLGNMYRMKKAQMKGMKPSIIQ